MKKLMLALSLMAAMAVLPCAHAINVGPDSQTGSVAGRVFKPWYIPLAGATVELNLGGDKNLTATTDDKGKFLFASVPRGSGYKLTASKTGFKTATVTGVNVAPGRTTTVNVTLKKP